MPKKKHWPWIATVTAVLAGAGLVLAYGLSASRDTRVPAAEGVRNGTMGTPVTQEGIFEYTVTSLDCGKTTVSGAIPKGRFCVLGVTVRNMSGVALKPGIAFAKAYDERGTGYLADAVAQIRAERDGSALLADLAPGARISDRLIYDVPKTATITSVVLRETPASAGITIALVRS
jgi:hypothetical protein